MNSMQNFLEKAKNDKSIRDEINKIGKTGDENKFKAFLLEMGVTTEDIEWGINYNKSFHTKEGGELNDNDLEMVAGGKACGTDLDPSASTLCVVHSMGEKNYDCCILYGKNA
ncbi:MAG: hypothetical protein CVV64_02755 [Candidatus Wallbacteria bacterium HGW-Wallbacteria-1]|uniref:Nif11 domain-containing protein n=1 Tax=Candidatus Wallbacteria bacterium HGW-Wallbacteria-1 TaxID=2013854 RepID=A0A2N1PTE4_9BACT|nr:MAG: hypothetical protein CVV64_02755 [Candidatus Wallbacteria bacterium HGW-Wallbacteria-1]